MAAAESGDVEEAAQLAYRRLKAKGLIIDRTLSVAPGSVEIIGSLDYLKSLFEAWNRKPKVKKQKSVPPAADSPISS